MTHKICFGGTCKHAPVLDENKSASLSIKKHQRKIFTNTSPASNHKDKSSRPTQTVCVHAHNESNGSQEVTLQH